MESLSSELKRLNAKRDRFIEVSRGSLRACYEPAKDWK